MTQSHQNQPFSASIHPPQTVSSYDLALALAQVADDRKGVDITVLAVQEISFLADYFVIVTGYSHVQVRAIARAMEDQIRETWQQSPLRTEGQAEGSWVLQDYGDVIAHIFLPHEREYYNLEAFWGHAQKVALPTNTRPHISRM